jgi:signal transduction histidine kinase
VSFVVAVLRRHLSTAGVAELVSLLSRGVTPGEIETVLGRTLADPDLRVLYWNRDLECYVDANGARAELPAGGPDVDTVPVRSSAGHELAAVLMRRPGIGHDELVSSALSASALALENAQLQAELKAQLVEVKASRLRIVEAGVEQRRRMERDLHDGAQQRLLGVKLTLGAAEAARTPERASALITQARDQVGEALEELRDLARGLHPPLLSQAGLAVAVRALAENMPLEVTTEICAERFPPAIEVTAYFIISEGLANVTRHAGARRVLVHAERDGNCLVVRVSDDGKGGADLGGGTGLAGLQDRAKALGGRLALRSPSGRGTELVAEIPCA